MELSSLDKPELGREKDLVALSSPSEPFSQELLIVAIETM
jgi:hypothetical protein